MLEMNAVEGSLLVLWALGLVAALTCLHFGRSRRLGIGALIAALIIPVLGSVLAIAGAASVVAHNRRAARGRQLRRATDQP